MKKTTLLLSLIIMTVLGYAGFRNSQARAQQFVPAQGESRAPRAEIAPRDRKAKVGVQGYMGFVVRVVEPGSTTEEAGIRPGDIITHINGTQVYTIQDIQKVWGRSPGEHVSVEILRFGPDGQAIKTEVSGRLKSH